MVVFSMDEVTGLTDSVEISPMIKQDLEVERQEYDEVNDGHRAKHPLDSTHIGDTYQV
jgi:hypothetical protein